MARQHGSAHIWAIRGTRIANGQTEAATHSATRHALEKEAARRQRRLACGVKHEGPDVRPMSEFVSVAEVASLPPGTGRTVHVSGREFAIWNVDGQFYCI